MGQGCIGRWWQVLAVSEREVIHHSVVSPCRPPLRPPAHITLPDLIALWVLPWPLASRGHEWRCNESYSSIFHLVFLLQEYFCHQTASWIIRGNIKIGSVTIKFLFLRGELSFQNKLFGLQELYQHQNERDQGHKASDVFNGYSNAELTQRYIIILVVDDEQMHDSLSITNTGSQNMHSPPARPIKYFMHTQSIIFVFTPFLHRYFSLYWRCALT